MINIAFYSPSIDLVQSTKFVCPNFFYLKTYIDLYSKNKDNINWEHIIYDDIESNKLANWLVDIKKIDVLCLGVYIWNESLCYSLAEKVKELNPNIIIIIGGPQQLGSISKEFLETHSYIDYCVYGDGQVPFLYLIDSIIENKEIDYKETSNLCYIKDQEYCKSEHQIFKDNKFLSVSPWIKQKSYLVKVLNYYKSKDIKVVLNWETSRGCPYSCVFCDWSSGLHNKVSKFKIGVQLRELLMFAKLGILAIRISDANFGQYAQDLEITKFWIKVAKKYPGTLYINDLNFSKLSKERSYHIADLFQQAKLNQYNRWTFSVQDTDYNILKMIQRPDIPWEDHKKMIKTFLDKHPETMAAVELICGFPSQNYKTYFDMCMSLLKENFFIRSYSWQFLPMSPVTDKTYQETYKIKLLPINYVIKENGNEFVSKVVLCYSEYKTEKYDVIRLYLLSNLINSILFTHIELFKKIIDKSNVTLYDILIKILYYLINNKMFLQEYNKSKSDIYSCIEGKLDTIDLNKMSYDMYYLTLISNCLTERIILSNILPVKIADIDIPMMMDILVEKDA